MQCVNEFQKLKVNYQYNKQVLHIIIMRIEIILHVVQLKYTQYRYSFVKKILLLRLEEYSCSFEIIILF